LKANSVHPWKSGEVVVLRGVWRHKLCWACSAIIVQDTPELIAIYWPAGTPNRIPAKRSTPHDLLLNDIHLIPHNWVETDVLMLVKPGSAHAVNVMWEAGQAKLRCWYINLQEPLRRTKLGFDSMDHLLDIVISPDLSAWRWKDEDEFSAAVALGVFSAEEARAIRAEGERTIELLLTRQSPFRDGWESWRPPSKWEIPPLLKGWDELSEGESS
jgi:hypothetical protein